MAAFLGDLYFAMDENARMVADMTPVSAIRGEYRIKKEKLRRRKSRLFGRLFGLNGDYAYKNIKRNPGRFYRTISAMTLGIAASIVIFGVLATLAKYKEFQDKDNGYYHVYYEHTLMPWESESELMNSLPKFDKMQQVSEMQGIKRFVYGAGVVVLFIVVMSVVNTINATAGNLFMRKKELAQLRVLGASKSDVFRMVMFEGVLEAVIACFLGTVLGTGLSLGVYYGVFGVFTATRYVFPWLASILNIVVVSFILCGAVYVPLKQMPMDVAGDLATAGE
jgi:ABC-type antimicrobial peptide transport system permease subunit